MPDDLTEANLDGADVLLYRGEGWLAKAIRFFDGSDVNHAGLYLGGGVVGEALGKGLERRSLAVSIGDHTRVLARRLKDTPSDMSPVVTRGETLLTEGHRYAYEQLLLLAFLGLTRKVKVTPVLRVLLRKVLDSAAAVVAKIVGAGKEPMICSEYVYRCYDEALPQADDVFSIDVAPLASAPPVLAAAGALPAARRVKGRGLHPESLLALTVASPMRAWRPRPALAVSPARDTDGVDLPGVEDLIRQYLDEATRPMETKKGRAARVGAGPAVSDEQLQASVFRFAATLHAHVPPREGPRVGAARIPTVAPVSAPLKNLLDTVADFVTPGDLMRSDSLLTVGDLALTGSVLVTAAQGSRRQVGQRTAGRRRPATAARRG